MTTDKKIVFTAPRINALKCEEGKNQSIYWDTKTPSLGVRVTQSGAKAYIFQTWLNANSLRITIGYVNSWSIAAAQAEARRLKVLTDQGIDPRELNAAAQAEAMAKRVKVISGLTIWADYIEARKHTWGDRHLADHFDMVRLGGEVITRGLRTKQAKTKKEGILRNVLDRPINEITRNIIEPWLKQEASIRPARARIALSALKAFLTWVGDQEQFKLLVDTGACDRLSKELPAKKAKDDCLDKQQLKAWFREVKKISNPIICAYLQVLLLTGARRNELATLRWEEVDLTWHKAVIRDKVEGVRVIPITPYVECLIKSLPRVNRYVFSSINSKSGHLTEPRKAHQMAIENAGIKNLSIHGLRRSLGTLSEWVETPVGISAQLMGHKPSALAEKHYRKRPIDLLSMWHTKIEKFILDEAGIVQPGYDTQAIRLVK